MLRVRRERRGSDGKNRTKGKSAYMPGITESAIRVSVGLAASDTTMPDSDNDAQSIALSLESDSEDDDFGDAQNSDSEQAPFREPVTIASLEEKLKQNTSNRRQLQAAPAGPPPLACEWQEVRDANGTPYYWHKPTSKTQYNRPVGVPVMGVDGRMSAM